MRPLTDRVVLLTRPGDRDRPLLEALIRRGARPVLAPAIRIEPTGADPDPAGFDWIAVTSPTAADHLGDRVRSAAAAARVPVVALGHGTRLALESLGIPVGLVASVKTGEGLARAMLEAGAAAGERVLHPTSDRARPEFRDVLAAASVDVVEVIAYRTLPALAIPADAEEAIRRGRVGAVVFASPSAVDGFLAALPPDLRDPVRAGTSAVAIGPTTARALRDAAWRVVLEAATPTVEGLLDAMESGPV